MKTREISLCQTAWKYTFLILAACMPGCVSAALTPAIGSAWQPQPVSDDQAQQVIENCGSFGQPRIRSEQHARIGPTQIVTYPEFVLQHSSLLKIPLWVAEYVTPTEVSGAIPRFDAFHPEPSLPSGQRAELSDYRFSTYQLGHMAPAGNQTVSADRKRETFTLANIVPQCVQQNLEIWDNLEDTMRVWARREPVYMITGPMFWDAREESPETADGLIEYLVLGAHGVAVPTHLYKIAARQRRDGVWEMIAFVIANDNGFPRPWKLADYIVSVDFVESRTGIDFFPAGSAEIERAEADKSGLWR